MNIRVARHTDDLEKIKLFYTEVLGLQLLGSFENHDNYNGIFLGNPESNWHFEFTQSDQKALHTSDEDDLFVLYPETEFEYNAIINRILKNNISFIPSKNPYWVSNGKMILDPDGYRIVISSQRIKEYNFIK